MAMVTRPEIVKEQLDQDLYIGLQPSSWKTVDRIVDIRDRFLESQASAQSDVVVQDRRGKIMVVCDREGTYLFIEGNENNCLQITPEDELKIVTLDEALTHTSLYKKLNAIKELSGRRDVIIEIMKIRSHFKETYTGNTREVSVPKSDFYFQYMHNDNQKVIVRIPGRAGRETFVCIFIDGKVFSDGDKDAVIQQAEEDHRQVEREEFHRQAKSMVDAIQRVPLEEDSFDWSWDGFIAMVTSWIEKSCCSSSDDAKD